MRLHITFFRMLTIYFLVSCVLSATYAVAVEHPVRRYSRSHDGGRGSLRLTVKPEYTEMRRGDTVPIRCRARGTGDKMEETPLITFYVSTTFSVYINVYTFTTIQHILSKNCSHDTKLNSHIPCKVVSSKSACD